MKQATTPNKEEELSSRRNALQKLAGFGIAASAAAVALLPEEALASPDQTVSTVATLRSTNPANGAGTIAFAQGYAQSGDGGAGLFVWDPGLSNPSTSEIDDGLTVIQVGGTGAGRWKRTASGFFNIKWFGAKGNGTTDDCAAITNAINAALTQGSGCILFPAGTYSIANIASNSFYHLLPNSGQPYKGTSGKLHLLGVGNAVLVSNKTSTLTYDVLLEINGSGYNNVTIENLTFCRSATASNGDTVAIEFFTNGDGTILRPTIRNCVFQDFSRALNLFNTEGALVTGCCWRYTKGRTVANPNAPDVGLWCLNATDTQIIANYWSGTEDMSSSNPALPMDGFIYGISKGWLIQNNIVRRALCEGIFPSNGGDATATCIIDGNSVDCDLPTGYTPASGGVGVRTAIRCDEYNCQIIANNIRNVTAGIVLYNFPTVRTGGLISDNHIVLESPNAQYAGTTGILIDSRQGLTVQNNRVLFSTNFSGTETNPISGISLANSVDVVIRGNTIYANVGTPGPSYTVCGLYLANGSTGAIITDNTFQGVGCGIWAQPSGSPDAYFRIGHNEYLYTLYQIGRYASPPGSPPSPIAIGTSECVTEIPVNTAPGWYRMFRGYGYINGTLSAVAAFNPDTILSAFPAESLDAEYILDYDYASPTNNNVGTGAIHQLNCGRAAKYITRIKISQYASTGPCFIAIDIYLAAVPPEKIRLIFIPADKWIEPNRYGNAYGIPYTSTSQVPSPDTTGFGCNAVTSLPAGPGILTSGRMLVGDGIGGYLESVGTQGAIIKRMRAYDSNGNFVGYIPVYSSL